MKPAKIEWVLWGLLDQRAGLDVPGYVSFGEHSLVGNYEHICPFFYFSEAEALEAAKRFGGEPLALHITIES